MPLMHWTPGREQRPCTVPGWRHCDGRTSCLPSASLRGKPNIWEVTLEATADGRGAPGASGGACLRAASEASPGPIQIHFLFRRGEAPSKLGNSSEKFQPQLSCPLVAIFSLWSTLDLEFFVNIPQSHRALNLWVDRACFLSPAYIFFCGAISLSECRVDLGINN